MTRLQFLLLATCFQGGILVLGMLLGDWFDITFHIQWNFNAIARGLLATIPMLLLFWWVMKTDWKAFRNLREVLVKQLGPLLVPCSWWDLVYISLLAGLSEEVLFRGALQNSLSHWGLGTSLVITSLLFGACHAANLTYFLYATGAGLYLSWVAGLSEQNLLPAIVTHAAYDLIALRVVQSLARSSTHQQASITEESTQNTGPSVDCPPETP